MPGHLVKEPLVGFRARNARRIRQVVCAGVDRGGRGVNDNDAQLLLARAEVAEFALDNLVKS